MVFGYYAVRIAESELCERERHPVFLLIFRVLFRIPFERLVSGARYFERAALGTIVGYLAVNPTSFSFASN